MARKSKFLETEIIEAMREVQAGATQTEVAGRFGVSRPTIQRWLAKYGGMTLSKAMEKRRIDDENRKLRARVAKYALENQSLRAALGKEW